MTEFPKPKLTQHGEDGQQQTLDSETKQEAEQHVLLPPQPSVEPSPIMGRSDIQQPRQQITQPSSQQHATSPSNSNQLSGPPPTKTTSNPGTPQYRTGTTDSSIHISDSSRNVHSTRRRLRRSLLTGFVVSINSIGAFFPILASVTTLIIYFSPGLAFSIISYPSPWIIPLEGLISAFILSSFYVYFSSPFNTVAGTGMQDFSLLERSLNELRARLGNPPDEDSIENDDLIRIMDIPDIKHDGFKLTALREAYNYYFALYRWLYSPRGYQAISSEDAYAWGMIHATEEALIEFEPTPIVIREAMRDYSAIRDSAIDNRDELLEKLARALGALDPEATAYFKESEYDKKLAELLEEMQAIRKILDTNHSTANQQKQSDPEAQSRARAILRQIKHTLNEFREKRLAGIIQARDNLKLSTIASGIITYALLCLGITTSFTSSTIATGVDMHTSGNQLILSAITLYIIGVTTGLFGRLYAESNKESATNDYGLSRARLFAIPLISGLAAVGGVFITAVVLPIASGSTTQLTNIFTFDARYVLAAMLFGFTPNLLIKSLQQKSDKYASDLESTKEK